MHSLVRQDDLPALLLIGKAKRCMHIMRRDGGDKR